jgi:asparagine synthase (glutamine-hydrolysing)
MSLLSLDLRQTLNADSIAAPLVAATNALPHSASPLDQMLYLEGKFFLADHNLNYTDKMAMAHGVEVRVPLLDLDLISFVASLPDNLKQRGRVGKWIFKQAMAPYLPQEVIYRPKTGFGVPLRHWLQGGLRPLLNELLSEQSIRRRGIFDAMAVSKLIADDRARRVDAAYTLLALMCIEIWCRLFLDGDSKKYRGATTIRPAFAVH